MGQIDLPVQVLSLVGLAFLLFLAGYWPDLAAIEEAFSTLKTALRRTGARTREALEAAIAQAFLTITAQDACGWYQHGGYRASEERKN